MALGTIAALICIVLAFVVGLTDEKIIFDPLTWFVAAVAFALLGGPVFPRRGA